MKVIAPLDFTRSSQSKICRMGDTIFETTDSKQTKLTYLPPIQKPITEYATFFEMFRQFRELARKANMKYTHITLDAGAAIKAYHVIWNNPNLWSDTQSTWEISMQSMRTLEQLAHLSVEAALKISCFKLDFALKEALWSVVWKTL